MSDSISRFENMQQLQKMKARYQNLQKLRDEFEDHSDDDEDVPKTQQSSISSEFDSANDARRGSTMSTKGSSRKGRKQSVWVGLKGAIIPEAAPRKSRIVIRKAPGSNFSEKSQSASDAELESAKESKEVTQTPEELDAALDQYWSSYKFNLPPEIPLQPFNPPPPPKIEEEFAEAKDNASIVIGKIPKAAISEQKAVLKARLWEERERSVQLMKTKERDLLWRENLAKKRVEQLEKESRERLQTEKMKVEQKGLDRERLLGREFRRAREALESSVKNQNGQLGEVFGTPDMHAQQSMARKMYVKSTTMPQPVEFRIRFLRAVKSKLPKGAYLLMLTQYESLGGRPLSWTKLGSHGIGNSFPGTTKTVKHYGRYFDRTMKFEDSCFALCPPANMRTPGLCFILELFQLKSRTNPEDKQVAWTALPMCNEEMNVAEGKLKLPLLRGQHTPRMAGFRQMEKAIATDLDNWLCNIYLDVRTFSLSEMITALDNSELYKQSIKLGGQYASEAKKSKAQLENLVKLNRYVNFDFLNKRLLLQNGMGKYSRTFGQKEKADDQLIKPDPSGLFHRKKHPNANGEALQTGYEDKVIDDIIRNKPLHGIASTGNLLDVTNEDEDKRKRLLLGGSHDVSFRHFDDGFGSYSAKDVYSEDNLHKNVWTPLRRWLNRASAFLRRETYIPSESDGMTPSRRYQNPHMKLNSPHSQAKMVPLSRGSSKSSRLDHSMGSADESARTKTVEDLEKGDVHSDLQIVSQVEAERKQLKKQKSKQTRKAVRDAMAGTDGMQHVAVETGNAYSVFTKDVPDHHIVQNSVQFLSTDTDDILKEVDGNDENLDSDGFSSDGSHEGSSDYGDDLIEVQNLDVVDFFETEAGKDSRADVTVIERGLETETSGPAKALHDEQSGKIVGVETVDSAKGRFYASSGVDRKVIRRLQSDGLRLDSEILDNNAAGNTDAESAAQLKPASFAKKSQRLWTPLDNKKDLELYDMSLCSDIAKRAHLLPSAIAAVKIRFLMLEAFGDFMPRKWGSFEFYASILTLIFSFWLRIYVHFLAQFLYLGVIKVPSYSFEMSIVEVKYKYMSAGITQGSEILLLCIGPCACIAVFAVFMLGGLGLRKLGGGIPDGLSTFLSCFGLMTVLDPFLILLVDLLSGNFNCGDSCIDYTDPSCKCFTGDWMKLYDRMNAESSGSGITGVLITVMIFFGISIISALFYHEYLIHIHRDGRILDLWRRVHSMGQEFFLPDDFEISRDELVHICTKASQWRGGGGDIRRLSITKLIEKDAEDQDFLSVSKLYSIYEMSMDGTRKKLYRQFLLAPEGYITEVFSDFQINESFIATTEKEKQLVLMENWKEQKNAPKQDSQPKVLTTAQRVKQGLFSGLERA